MVEATVNQFGESDVKTVQRLVESGQLALSFAQKGFRKS